MSAELDQERLRYIENFALAWKRMGLSAMSGRVLAYLLISDEDYVSTAQIAADLGTSQPAVSTSTRELLDAGQIHRHRIPGDRSHYFVADDDPWSVGLRQSPVQQAVRAAILPPPSIADELGERSRSRLRNASDYHVWLEQRSAALLEEWEAYKRNRDAAAD